MTNYYKRFEEFKKQQKLTDTMPLEIFKQRMMIFFGFGGRNKTVARWLTNFQDAGLIRIKKINEDEHVVEIIG